VTKPYHVKVAPQAQRQIKKLPSKHSNMIIKLIEALAINPRPPGSKKVDGMNGLYRESMNQHRLIYKIEEQDILILLVKDNRCID
jgi:mRNA interferase RelE/StbE